MNTLHLYFGVIILVFSAAEGRPNDNSIPGSSQDDNNNSEDEIVIKNGTQRGIIDIVINLPESCFPSDAYLRRDDGVQIKMNEVKIGDKVLTIDDKGNPIYSEISMMIHRDNKQTLNDYVKITTEGGVDLTMSKYHLLALSSSTFIFSKDIRPGQNVTVYNPDEKRFHPSQVISVEYVTKTGLHAPLSMEGTLVVNDVYVSCYANFPIHWISHTTFSLWRGLYKNFPSLLSSSTDVNNIHWYPSMLISAASLFSLLPV
jgi:hypothetical protein